MERRQAAAQEAEGGQGMTPALDIRILTAADAPAYRALRQRIRNSPDARFFADSFTREAALTESQWLEWCSETPEHCIVGTFDGGELVGIVMVTRYGDAEDSSVEWEAAWLAPCYRFHGIAAHAYQRVELWTAAHGYQHALVFIREDNFRWLAIREKHGFRHAGKLRNVQWADGTTADAYALELNLHAHSRIKTATRRVA
jgi:RimJ/RimL family protein N-acetyltransferase